MDHLGAIASWSLPPVLGDFMSYQSSLIGKPNEWGDDKATLMTIRNPGYDLGCPPGHCSRRMKEGELHYQRSDPRYQPACSFVFCLGCFEILWGKQFFARVRDEEDCWENSDIQSTCTISQYDWYLRKRILSFGFHSLIPSRKKSPNCPWSRWPP